MVISVHSGMFEYILDTQISPAMNLKEILHLNITECEDTENKSNDEQTVLENMAEDDFNISLAEIKRPILSFNEDTLVSAAWEEILKRKEHIAQVQNEYGCFLGVVTMEDIIETIIGQEIVDESDAEVDLQAYAREKWMTQMK